MSSEDMAAALDLTFDQLTEEFSMDQEEIELAGKAMGLLAYHLGWQAGFEEHRQSIINQTVEAKENGDK